MSLAEIVGIAVTLMLALIGAFWALLSLVFKQFERRIEGKLSAIEQDAQEWIRLEKDFLKFQAELPERYVRREDWIRNQTILEAKMDGLGLKIDNWQLKEVVRHER